MNQGPIYQDWEPVVLKKTQSLKKQGSIANPAGHKKFVELNADEIPKLNYVSKEEAQTIIQGRKAKDLKQEDLARMLNINVSIIKDFENQKSVSNKQLYSKMLKALGLKI
jgi:ribosome-binding protein aMBF1 (putative translation factor)